MDMIWIRIPNDQNQLWNQQPSLAKQMTIIRWKQTQLK
jgi:hypothetical protein